MDLLVSSLSAVLRKAALVPLEKSATPCSEKSATIFLPLNLPSFSDTVYINLLLTSAFHLECSKKRQKKSPKRSPV